MAPNLKNADEFLKKKELKILEACKNNKLSKLSKRREHLTNRRSVLPVDLNEEEKKERYKHPLPQRKRFV